MAPDASLTECARLARAMTFKNAAAGLSHGGGKSSFTPTQKWQSLKKEPLMRALAKALRTIEEYFLAPSMNTDEECMAWIRDEIGDG